MIHFNIVLLRKVSSLKCSVRPSGFSFKVLQAFAIFFTHVIIHQLKYTVDSNTKHIKCCRICTGGDVYICKHAYVCTSKQNASSVLLHRASCRFTKYHTINKCTNCMSFILNHFFKTLFTAPTSFDSISLIIIREHI